MPEGWEEKAKESKAICRTRKVSSAEELLRVELLHFGEGLSLKETSAVALCCASLKADSFSAERVLELYRLRWQVELAFKRLKSIMQLEQLPKTDPESCRAWLYGKMLYALLCYAIVDKGRSFSPWGYLFKVS